MMENKSELFSPQLRKYEKILQQNPQSRVFAPLAEIYRKFTMIDKAMVILKDGIRYNSTYTLGYLGLAQCYYDRGEFRNCYATLRPLVASNGDNFVLQRLFARACEELGLLEEALATYKHLLYLGPKQRDVRRMVTLLEEKIVQEEEGEEEFFLREKKFFDSGKLTAMPTLGKEMIEKDEGEVDQWEKVDLNQMAMAEEKADKEDSLMELYDQEIGDNRINIEAIKEGLWAFGTALKSRAKEASN